MLSMVTPLGESSRSHRYRVTVAWFVAGATVGGACLGAGMAGLAVAVHRLSPTNELVALVVVGAAAVTMCSDAKVGGFALPRIPRQVNESWLNRYRGWVYGAGYGWQIGIGLSTYVMTAAVYLMIVLGALTGRPSVAFAIGTGFGVIRGVAILLGWRLRTPPAIQALHQRIESTARLSLAFAIAVQGGALVTAVLTLGASRVIALCGLGAVAGIATLAAAYPALRGSNFRPGVDPAGSRS
jgi:hypothetical protein